MYWGKYKGPKKKNRQNSNIFPEVGERMGIVRDVPNKMILRTMTVR